MKKLEKCPKFSIWSGPISKAHLYPHQLSGGEQQHVAHWALIHRAKSHLVWADEPAANPLPTEEIVRLLLEINGFGTTVLLATHNRSIVNSLGRRVIALEHGKIFSDEANGKYVMSSILSRFFFFRHYQKSLITSTSLLYENTQALAYFQ